MIVGVAGIHEHSAPPLFEKAIAVLDAAGGQVTSTDELAVAVGSASAGPT
jgi:hypothetical protein